MKYKKLVKFLQRIFRIVEHPVYPDKVMLLITIGRRSMSFELLKCEDVYELQNILDKV